MQLRKISQLYSLHARTLSLDIATKDDNRVRHSGPTATLLRARSFTLDGEAVVCGPDGVAIFDALHRRGTVTEAVLCAFDFQESTARTSAACR